MADQRTDGSRSSLDPHPHRHGVITRAWRRNQLMVKKIVPVIVALLASRRRLQVRPRQARRQGRSPSRRSTARSTCSRRSSSSTCTTAASRSCRSVSSWPTTTRPRSPPAAATARPPTPPEGYGAMTQEGVVRDVITDTLTDAEDTRAHRVRGPRASQGEDPQGHQEAHRCKGRARHLLRHHRPVRSDHGRNRRLRTLRDHHCRADRGPGARARQRRGALAPARRAPSSWPSRWGARR